MVMVNKVPNHGIPCLNLEPKHIPRATTLNAACIGPNGEKSYVVWILS
jgi:hypothetical protein